MREGRAVCIKDVEKKAVMTTVPVFDEDGKPVMLDGVQYDRLGYLPSSQFR